MIAALSTFSDLVEHDLKEGRKERRHKEKSPGHPSEIILLSQVISPPLFRPQGAGVAARTPCHAARVSCHISKSAEYAKSRPFYATSGFLIYAVFYAVSGFGLSIISTFPSAR